MDKVVPINSNWNIIVGERANGIGFEYKYAKEPLKTTTSSDTQRVYVVISELLDSDKDEIYIDNILGVFCTEKKAQEFINGFGHYSYCYKIREFPLQ